MESRKRPERTCPACDKLVPAWDTLVGGRCFRCVDHARTGDREDERTIVPPATPVPPVVPVTPRPAAVESPRCSRCNRLTGVQKAGAGRGLCKNCLESARSALSRQHLPRDIASCVEWLRGVPYRGVLQKGERPVRVRAAAPVPTPPVVADQVPELVPQLAPDGVLGYGVAAWMFTARREVTLRRLAALCAREYLDAARAGVAA
ncbi:hypothetical protein L6V77_19240 [Myxococcota bacterium]|nr:hypothetical protein [Myxococcota bacterium]